MGKRGRLLVGIILVMYSGVDLLDRARKLWDAPVTVWALIEWVWHLIETTNPLAWLILLVGLATLFTPWIEELWRALTLPTQPTSATSKGPARPDDTDVRSALYFLANGSWTTRYSMGDPEYIAQLERIFDAVRAFEDAASMGGVQVWGRYLGMSRPLRPIEKEHWHDWQIEALSVLGKDDLQTIVRGRQPIGDGPFTDLRANRAEITQLRAREHRAETISASVSAYVAALANGRELAGRNVETDDAYRRWHQEYLDWIAATTNAIRKYSGHRMAGRFDRCPEGLYIPQHLGGFNVGHNGALNVLRPKIEFLRDLLENEQDRA